MTNGTEKAITKAIEGGWTPDGEAMLRMIKKRESTDPRIKAMVEVTISHMLFTPLFWQALGKELGKFDSEEKKSLLKKAEEAHKSAYEAKDYLASKACLQAEASLMTEFLFGDWQGTWHRFIDHLIAGKPIDDFFNNLLKK